MIGRVSEEGKYQEAGGNLFLVLFFHPDDGSSTFL
jgi:hypothetical protein